MLTANDWMAESRAMGRALAAELRRRHLTRKAFGQAAGIGQTRLWEVLNGRCGVTQDFVDKVREAIGLDLNPRGVPLPSGVGSHLYCPQAPRPPRKRRPSKRIEFTNRPKSGRWSLIAVINLEEPE